MRQLSTLDHQQDIMNVYLHINKDQQAVSDKESWRKYSIGCEFDNTSTSFVLKKDGNVEVEVERRTCSDTHSVKNYLLQCNDSGDFTVTIQAKDVTHNMNNTTWQCSDNISQSPPFLLLVYTPPTSGPITEIKGGNRPFKFGDV
ncbi:Hypothetical predicted protein, partial [Mytilus galloprovincialis]